MRVVFVGAGNLATRLSLEMRKSGMSIGQVYSHTSEHAKILADELGCGWTVLIICRNLYGWLLVECTAASKQMRLVY